MANPSTSAASKRPRPAKPCALEGLSHSRAPLWCELHKRWHGSFDLRRESVIAAVEAYERRTAR